MAKQPVSRATRLKIATGRLRSILGRHAVALGRTLEHKIADAGPGHLRIHPHIFTEAKRDLLASGEMRALRAAGSPWFYLANTDPALVQKRLDEQSPIQSRINSPDLHNRIGQTLEIAIFKALRQQTTLSFNGAFRDLDEHDDSKMYSKQEPPSDLSGRFLKKGTNLDFLVSHPQAGHAGLEAKNLREWLYPDRPEVKDLIYKSCCLDIVPVLIARRIPFVTFKLMRAAGGVVHQTYNQVYPASEAALAAQAAHKNLLGYHDIRVGNEPDKRLLRFLLTNLPAVLPDARARFDEYKDLLLAYSSGEMK